MEKLIIERNQEVQKEYPKNELILDEYICEICGKRYELCDCGK